jgi:hypothetical protein
MAVIVNAQDVITLKNGNEIKAKVAEISDTEIKYKRFDNLDGPTIVIAKNEVFIIKYENGTREVINAIEAEKPTVELPIANKEVSGASTGNDYVLLHIYRKGSMIGAAVSYSVHLDDDPICRVTNKWKETIKIDREGLITLWARTEVKKEVSIDAQFGGEYYIRCSVTMGGMVGRPHLELVDEATGKKEFNAIKEPKKKK